MVEVEDPVTVNKHPLGKGFLLVALYFDVDQQPGLAAVLAPDLEQLVRQPATDAGVADDLLELFVEAFIATLPIDAIVDTGKEESQERGQEILEGLFPRTVQVARGLPP